jgi:hypothetical protein
MSTRWPWDKKCEPIPPRVWPRGDALNLRQQAIWSIVGAFGSDSQRTASATAWMVYSISSSVSLVYSGRLIVRRPMSSAMGYIPSR